MPTPIPDAAGGGQNFEWSETLHAFLFRARIYLKRYWWIFLLTISGGIFFEAVQQYQSAPEYESDATMMVNGRVVTPGQTSAAGYQEDMVNFYNTQASIMMSGAIQSPAYKLTLSEVNAPDNYHPRVTPFVQQKNGTSLLQLTVKGSDRDFTQKFLERWMDQFLSFKSENEADALSNFKQNEEIDVTDTEKEIETLTDKKQQFLQQNNTDDVNKEVASLGAQLAAISGNLNDKQAEEKLIEKVDLPLFAASRDEVPQVFRDELAKAGNDTALKAYDALGNQTRLDTALAAYDQNVQQIDRRVLTIPGFVTARPEYTADEQRLLDLQAVREQFAKDLGDEHRIMVGLQNQIDDLETKLEVFRKQICLDIQNQLSVLKLDIAGLTDEMEDTRKTALQYGKLQSDYDKIESDLAQAIKNHDAALQAVSGVQHTLSFDQPILSIFEHASDPTVSRPNPVRQIGIGAAMGFISGAMLIFVLGALDGRVMSVEDITQRFDESMLGVIPMQKRIGGQVALLQNDDQRQMFAESCRNIRSSLLYMDRQGKRPQTILLTSSVPSEGKSTISANLAITLSFAASKTLLIDADLRRGQLHKQFGVANDVGLAEALQGEQPIEKVIQDTQYENLHFIPCGKYPAQPGELLMTEAFRQTMQELKQKYDFIIFDSPPVMATDDTSSFATRVDAAIFVVRAGYTRLRQVRSSLENLHRRSVNVYGMIINFIDHREPGYYSYKYYDYYSYRTPADGGKGGEKL